LGEAVRARGSPKRRSSGKHGEAKVQPLIATPTADARAARGAKRKQILEAATRVFASRGYHGARVSDIAREAGIAYGLVYHYFRNKDEILDTIFAERWGAFLDVVDGIAAGTQPASEKLRQLAALVLYAYRRRPDWVKVLVFEIQRTSRFSEPEQIEAVGRLFRSVAQIVRAGQEAGELRRELDANVVCLAFIGALETMITSQVLKVMRLPEQSPAEDDRTVNTVVALFLGGLAVRSGS
jgi:AcrR family transcriptional regulator